MMALLKYFKREKDPLPDKQKPIVNRKGAKIGKREGERVHQTRIE
jgi:hypothetical protein